MGKQLEIGLQTPMRPSRIDFDIAADHDVKLDAALDWSDVQAKITVTQNDKRMDDRLRFGTLASGILPLRPGQYEFGYNAVVRNTNAAVRTFRVAIGLSLSTTNFMVSGDIICPGLSSLPVSLVNVAHLDNAGGTRSVTFRVLSTDGTDDDLVVESDSVGYIKLIGNEDET